MKHENGKIAKEFSPSDSDTPRTPKLLFFSTEAKKPASAAIINILMPIEKRCNSVNPRAISTQLDSIGIIPVCLPEDMLLKGFGKERKYVSLKRRTADIRLRISYEAFMAGSSDQKAALCRENLANAAKIIAAKDKSFNLQRFLSMIAP